MTTTETTQPTLPFDRCTCITDDGVQIPGSNPACPVDGWDEDEETNREIDMDKICEMVRRCGIECIVEQTGGGTATIFAGPLVDEDEGRYVAAAGPGVFRHHDGWNFRGAYGWSEEFYVGFDDGGTCDPVEIDAWNEPRIAEILCALVERGTGPRPQ